MESLPEPAASGPRQAEDERTGVEQFALEVAELAAAGPADRQGRRRFIHTLGERYAFIRPQDMGQPLRFLRQMAGAPPIQLGTTGFRPDILDDYNPARHYTAFVWVGYWLPLPLAVAVLYLWEIASFVRYGGAWSPADILSGHIGVRHGRAVSKMGARTLPGLIATELTDPAAVDVPALLAKVEQRVEVG